MIAIASPGQSPIHTGLTVITIQCLPQSALFCYLGWTANLTRAQTFSTFYYAHNFKSGSAWVHKEKTDKKRRLELL